MFAQSKKIDSLNKVVTIGIDTEKVKALLTLTDEYAFSNNDTILHFSYRAMKILLSSVSKKEKNLKRYFALKAQIFSNVGFCYFQKSQNPVALEYYDEAVLSAVRSGDSSIVSGPLINRGMLYRNVGDKSRALDDYLRAEKIVEANGNKAELAPLLNNISVLYADLSDDGKTADYMNKSLSLAREMKEKREIARIMANIGIRHQLKGRFDPALLYFDSALVFVDSTQDKFEYANLLRQKAVTYYTIGKKKEAYELYNHSIRIYESLHSESNLAAVLQNLGRSYKIDNRIEEALACSIKSYDYSLKTNRPELTINSSYLLYSLYKMKKDMANALKMHEVWSKLKDSLNGEKEKKKILQKQFQFDFEKKSALMKVENEKNNLEQREELKRQQLTSRFAVIGVVLLVVFSLFLFNRFRIIARQKKEIESQKQLVEEKQKEVMDSIHYAKRIQSALVTSEFYINKQLKKLNV